MIHIAPCNSWSVLPSPYSSVKIRNANMTMGMDSLGCHRHAFTIRTLLVCVGVNIITSVVATFWCDILAYLIILLNKG